MREYCLGGERVLLTADTGDYAFVSTVDAARVRLGTVEPTEPLYSELWPKGLLQDPNDVGLRRLEAAIVRTRKSFLLDGPSLHIFVVTLRCDHSCQYCQVSRAAPSARGKDMSIEDAAAAVERVFESPARNLTIEFQGGEPGLRFDLVRRIVELAKARNEFEQRDLRFTMATTLHLLSAEDLGFCRDHKIHLSTSIDGPAELHSRQRPNPTRDSGTRTIAALERAREALGHDAVVALPTITREALRDPVTLIEHYRRLGFSSIFLRPLSPFGFAAKTRRAIGYDMAEFVSFYALALEHILQLNEAGVEFREVNAATMLRHIETPFHSGYMDLRSPSGAGLGVLVYNYDGRVYPSDEARMAAETGDARFCLGRVQEPLSTLLASAAMRWLAEGAVADQQTPCRSCAFLPYCGADPVHHAVTQGEPWADRSTSEFCVRNKGIFDILFRHLERGAPETLRTFASWALHKPRSAVVSQGAI